MLEDPIWTRAFQLAKMPIAALGSTNVEHGTIVPPNPFTNQDIDEVLTSWVEDGEAVGLFTLKDGRFASISYKSEGLHLGHAVIHGICYVANSFESIVKFGLGDEERSRLEILL